MVNTCTKKLFTTLIEKCIHEIIEYIQLTFLLCNYVITSAEYNAKKNRYLLFAINSNFRLTIGCTAIHLCKIQRHAVTSLISIGRAEFISSRQENDSVRAVDWRERAGWRHDCSADFARCKLRRVEIDNEWNTASVIAGNPMYYTCAGERHGYRYPRVA